MSERSSTAPADAAPSERAPRLRVIEGGAAAVRPPGPSPAASGSPPSCSGASPATSGPPPSFSGPSAAPSGPRPSSSGPSPAASGPPPSSSGLSHGPALSGPPPSSSGASPALSGPPPSSSGPSPAVSGPPPSSSGPSHGSAPVPPPSSSGASPAVSGPPPSSSGPSHGSAPLPPSAVRGHRAPSPRRGVFATVAAATTSWLLDPAEAGSGAESAPPAPPVPRPVVAVFGLARRCGATVVARALGAELAARDPSGAAAVSCTDPPTGLPLASPAAARLARTLADVPDAGARAIGRICLVAGAHPLPLADTARHHAPLVIDCGCDLIGGAAASVADRVVVVAGGRQEPALAAAAAACLERIGPEPLVVVNRARDTHAWRDRSACALPDSRLGAQLALSGREPRGALGQAISALADLCEAPR